MERMRRGIADQSTCEACGHVGEDINHIFRSCRVARDIWSLILPEVISANQLQWDFQNWWVTNIGNPNNNPLFGIGAWLIWKRRNKLVFDRVAWSAEEVRNQSKFWVLLLSLSWKAGQVGREAPVLARQTHLIGWRPADEGWCSLNSDGSLYSSNNRAAAGGLIRDHEGRLLAAFAANLGSCSIMRAELRGIIEGMRLA
ncbi:Putative ribonuclease H protein At1g65750 [Linum perenne]